MKQIFNIKSIVIIILLSFIFPNFLDAEDVYFSTDIDNEKLSLGCNDNVYPDIEDDYYYEMHKMRTEMRSETKENVRRSLDPREELKDPNSYISKCLNTANYSGWSNNYWVCSNLVDFHILGSEYSHRDHLLLYLLHGNTMCLAHWSQNDADIDRMFIKMSDGNIIDLKPVDRTHAERTFFKPTKQQWKELISGKDIIAIRLVEAFKTDAVDYRDIVQSRSVGDIFVEAWKQYDKKVEKYNKKVKEREERRNSAVGL